MGVALVVALVVPVGVASGQEPQARPSAVSGAVTERGTDEPLAGVSVILARDDHAVATSTTDEAGAFHLDDVAPGRYELRLERAGFREVRHPVNVPEGREVTVEVAMVAEAVELDPVVVTGEAQRPARSVRMAGFEERRAQGLGVYLTREDIEARSASRTTDLFRNLPRVRVGRGRGGHDAGGVLLSRAGCVLDVYLDGVHVGGGPVNVNDLVSPHDVEAVEIYRVATQPARFSDSNCGSVVIWTRSDDTEGAGPFTWRRLVAFATLLGTHLLLR